MSERIGTWFRWGVGIIVTALLAWALTVSTSAANRSLSTEHRMTVVEVKADANTEEHKVIVAKLDGIERLLRQPTGK
jgi:hypothetical protein